MSYKSHSVGLEGETIPEVKVKKSTEVTLRDVFDSGERTVYEYDFGDCWMHTIVFCCVIEDCKEPYPQGILAVEDDPMEDCGGPDFCKKNSPAGAMLLQGCVYSGVLRDL